jgi:cytochrome P450
MFAPSKFLSTSNKYFVDGNTFNPKRWIKGNKENENLNPYASLPFGFGARMCIGRRVAEQEIYLLITKVFSIFLKPIFFYFFSR